MLIEVRRGVIASLISHSPEVYICNPLTCWNEVDMEVQKSAIMWPLERLFLSHSAIVAFPRRNYEHGTLNIILCVLHVFLDSHDVLQCAHRMVVSSCRKSCEGILLQINTHTEAVKGWINRYVITSTRSITAVVGMTKQNIPLNSPIKDQVSFPNPTLNISLFFLNSKAVLNNITLLAT